MTHTEKLMKIFVERELRFAELIGKPITEEQAIEKAADHYARMEVYAEMERNETVVDVFTGKTCKRKDLHS
jgi:hypothetical protein